MPKRIAAIAVGALILGEAAARGIGLGTPPLSVPHPTIEYMFAPNQDVMRFHNRVLINEWGMRSEPVGKVKTHRREYRIFALGDSVLNGGAPSDQSELATTILSSGDTRVLNVSAGSWGPGNMLAYVETFGFFDADMIVLVLSSHDAYDVPTFDQLNPNTHPTHRPVSALYEGFVRYLPNYLPRFPGPVAEVGGEATDQKSGAIPALSELLSLASKQGPGVCHSAFDSE